jgi:hypothetical protein
MNLHNQELNQPAALLLSETVESVEIEGKFDESTETWSNRKFDCASLKKHSEAM